MNNKTIGDFGEALAEKYLLKKGHTIIEKNYRRSFGEIDIISIKDDLICFTEVKTRNSDKYGSPIEAVGRNKIKTIRKVAEVYLSSKKVLNKQPRFDIIGIVINKNKVFYEHIENAF